MNPAEATFPADFAFFDEPETQRALVRQNKPTDHEVTLLIDGIRCANCVLSIEKALRDTAGLLEFQVNPATRHARLRWNPQSIRLSVLLSQVRAAGYRPVPLRQGAVSLLGRDEYHRALKRLVVAGLGMMQVMTYAVALYAGAFDGMQPAFRQFFRLLSLLVATPVVFYSAAPFFRAAIRDLSHRRMGMDVPVALAIGVAYAASVGITFFGDLLTEVYFDSAVMFTFFLSIGRFAEMLARHRTMAAGDALTTLLPPGATRLVTHAEGDTIEEQIPLSNIRPGFRLLVRPGETIPADALVASGTSSVDESLLTGESVPHLRRPGDTVTGGSINLTGPLEVIVERTGSDTVLSGIERLLQRAQSERPPLAAAADRVAGYFVTTVLLIAAAVCAAWLAVDPGNAFTVTLAVLVVTCPCALSLATPTALTVATGQLARQGVLVTRGSAIEMLVRADTLLLDKTGTLTVGKLRVVDVIVLDPALTSRHCRTLAATLEAGSEHPIGAALRVGAGRHTTADIDVHTGCGIEGVVDGRLYRIGSLDFVAELSSTQPDYSLQTDITSVFLGDRERLLAVFYLEDTLRPDAAMAIARLRDLGLTPAILSGDARPTVERIADRLGIEERYAAMSPADKLAELERRQRAGQVTVMVGDGINDAPVLAGAHLSVAMGCGANLAQATADIVLIGNELEALARGRVLARKTMRIIRQNLGWAILYNLIALPVAAIGLIAPWMAAIGMSVSSLVVVLNALRLQQRVPVAATESVH